MTNHAPGAGSIDWTVDMQSSATRNIFFSSVGFRACCGVNCYRWVFFTQVCWVPYCFATDAHSQLWITIHLGYDPYIEYLFWYSSICSIRLLNEYSDTRPSPLVMPKYKTTCTRAKKQTNKQTNTNVICTKQENKRYTHNKHTCTKTTLDTQHTYMYENNVTLITNVRARRPTLYGWHTKCTKIIVTLITRTCTKTNIVPTTHVRPGKQTLYAQCTYQHENKLYTIAQIRARKQTLYAQHAQDTYVYKGIRYTHKIRVKVVTDLRACRLHKSLQKKNNKQKL